MFNHFEVKRNIIHWITALCTGGTYSRYNIWVIDLFIPISCFIKCVHNFRNITLDIWFRSVMKSKRQIAPHLSFNITSYFCMTQPSTIRNQLDTPLISRHTWECDLQHMYEIVYSGNKTHTNTGMDPLVPWCNLWIVPLKCRRLSKWISF